MTGREVRRVLAGCEPTAVFGFFEEICAIPHGSGNESALADHVEAFARERGLFCYRDGADNVLIRCPATPGHELASAVLLQGHLDMVCEQDAGVGHDFLRDGLSLAVEDGWIRAEGTTLGGDDGIAVAMMLAMLNDPPEPHPTLECLFTVSEETGLCGAWAFDPQAAGMTATAMINLDSESEGVLTAGCAGGVRTDITVPVQTAQRQGVAVRITLSGFSGGHSGVEIHEGHTNAILALGRLLGAASESGHPFELVSIDGGGKDNAIPREACAVVSVRDDDGHGRQRAEALCEAVRTEAERLRAEPNMIAADRAFVCSAEPSADVPISAALQPESTRAVLSLLTLVRNGALAMSAHVPGLVAYSRNLGIIRTLAAKDTPDGNGIPSCVKLSFSTRSASESHLDDAQRELSRLAELCGGTATHSSRYPGWDYAPVSPLRDAWSRAAEELFGMTLRVEVIHAGLECGILSSKRSGMDIISVGPDMRDIHTPRERLSVDSTARVWRILRAVVAGLA